MSKKSKGFPEFERVYREIYGDRWPRLLDALRMEAPKFALENPFFKQNQDVKQVYELDLASVLVAKQLQIQPDHLVLDMCAAPGGKSLVQIFESEAQAHWVLNDLSKARVGRLKRVIREYIPADRSDRVRVTNFDASRWGLHQAGHFDRVLLDAPCSGERHQLESPGQLEKWTQSSSKRLHTRQVALLCAGFDSLKPGGRIVYSTCSIAPLENDRVVEKLVKKRPDVDVQVAEADFGEKTDLGWQILPDHCDGYGPMYFSVIQKKI
ncbi:MAG: RNA methyltransferase [Bdellovibrionaceae bacterium]|nr:RNA methyltransferase [Pseudobdellovibrionaceae bacterium]